MHYIGEAKITGEAYLDIFQQALVAVRPHRLEHICWEINIGLFSTEQYRRFVDTLVSVCLEQSLQIINAKKPKKEHYFAICQKALAKDPYELKKRERKVADKSPVFRSVFQGRAEKTLHL